MPRRSAVVIPLYNIQKSRHYTEHATAERRSTLEIFRELSHGSFRYSRGVSDRIDGDCGYDQTLGKFKRLGPNKGERMRLPIVSGVIERRILANYRVDPARLSAVLPAPFRPQIVNGYGIGGICLIRLVNVRPKFLPIHWGVRSENAAHRIAVEWETDGTLMRGVYVPRRDTNSRLNVLAGGRIFPGLQHHASFAVNESCDRFDVRMKSDDGVARVHVSGRVAKALNAGSIFETLDTASAFFAQGSIGYSATQSQSRFDCVELKCADWQVEALEVDAIESSYFEDAVRFPAGSVEFDCALLMRNVVHEWHSREEICCAAQIEPARV